MTMDQGQVVLRRPNQMVLALGSGPGPILAFFSIIIFVFVLIIGVSILWSHPEVIGGYAMTVIGVVFIVLLVMIYRNPGVIYDNGVAVSRPMYERLTGGRTFYLYSDLLAIYPAILVTSSSMFEVRSLMNAATWTRYTTVGRYYQMYRSMVDDPGQRWGVGIETEGGSFVLAHMKKEVPGQQTPYQQMMGYIRYYLSHQGLDLMRKPLRLSDAELADLIERSQPLESAWMKVSAALSLVLPLLILFATWAMTIMLGIDLGPLAVPIILLTIIAGTAIFVLLFQDKVNRWVKANNRLSYHYHSLARL